MNAKATPTFTVARRTPIKITEYPDRLILFRVKASITFTHNDGNAVPAVRVDAVIIDHPDGPLVVRDVTVTQKVPVAILARAFNDETGPTLGRLRYTTSRDNPENMVWILTEPSEGDIDTVRSWLESMTRGTELFTGGH